MHLEFFVDDLEATGARVLAAGATRFEHQPNVDHCIVYADPAVQPFCLSMWGPESRRLTQLVPASVVQARPLGEFLARSDPSVWSSRR